MKLASVLLITTITASIGDRRPEFLYCVDDCLPSCKNYNPPTILKLLLWTCPENCKYTCMQNITNQGDVFQYYGKWPFIRILGVQELASVIFSILNGYQHYLGIKRYSNRINSNFRLKALMILYGWASIFTWFSSAVFHTRDFPTTEKLIMINRWTIFRPCLAS